MTRLAWLTARPIAHRGLHDAANGIVENSPSAIAAAADAGYSIELDVQLTADGDAVVFHDETLDRLTDERGAVMQRSCAELRATAYSTGSDRIASLAEILALVAGRVPLVIEIKSLWGHAGPLERRVAEQLRDYRGDVAVMSFDPRTVAEMRRIAPHLTRGIVASRYAAPEEWPHLDAAQRLCLRHLLHALKTRPQFVSYDANGLPAPAPWIARAMGVPVITWTIRSEAERARALRWSDQVTFEGFRA